MLLSLAATQATRAIRRATPSRARSCTRRGAARWRRSARFRSAAYYGSVDATPLFVLLAGRYYDRTGDRRDDRAACGRTSRPRSPGSIATATCDGDGFVEYARATDRGLQNQGWKDSHDSVFHADGTLAEGPIALCEVQGYVYAAKHARAPSWPPPWATSRARESLRAGAERLHQAFERSFWCDDLGIYALALDGAEAAVPRGVVERRAVPDERHRRARARRAVSPRR